MPKKVEDITGKRFGNLVVEKKLSSEERDELYGGNKYRKVVIFKCKCDCGKTTHVTRTHLQKGQIKSCGCMNKRNNNAKKFKKGRKVNDWTLLDMFIEYSKLYYMCECKCGEVKKVLATEIENEKSKRCTKCSGIKTGREKKLRNGYEEITLTFFNRIKISAERRSIDFDLSMEYLWELYLNQNKKCALSGIDITFGNGINCNTITCSLDRIDSCVGYEEGNVQWVHKDINKMKWKFEEDKFIEYCNKVSCFKEGVI
jgi:hypothetical protein